MKRAEPILFPKKIHVCIRTDEIGINGGSMRAFNSSVLLFKIYSLPILVFGKTNFCNDILSSWMQGRLKRISLIKNWPVSWPWHTKTSPKLYVFHVVGTFNYSSSFELILTTLHFFLVKIVKLPSHDAEKYKTIKILLLDL